MHYDYMHVLRSRRGSLYVVAVETGTYEPQVTLSWYPTGVSAQVARDKIGPFEGLVLKQQGDGRYTFDQASIRGVEVTLTNAGRTLADFTETFPLTPPRTKRKGQPYFVMGEWSLKTKRGDEWLGKIDLTPFSLLGPKG
jgi:hypothetical protein